MAANFCFDFAIAESDQDSLAYTQKPNEKKANECTLKMAEFINPTNELLKGVLNGQPVAQIIELPRLGNDENKYCLRHFSVKYVESLMRDSHEYSFSGTSQALRSNSDLIPSVYEGGMKIWECSVDLIQFLHKIVAEQGELVMAGKKVLELGCGAGLPGIYALLNGATVHFQDYNEEVLKLFTIPNAALSLNSQKLPIVLSENWTLLETLENTCKFVSGDWSSASSILEASSYDVILTSETIYNIDRQQALYDLIRYTLKPSGVVFVAAKSYYFGVGGGTDQFVNFVRKDGVFDVCTVCTHCDGVKREILKMEMVS